MPVLDDKNFDIDIKNGVSVVEFFSFWDSGSRVFEDSFKALSDEFRGKAKFIASEINANPILAQKQGVTRVPTVLVYVNGKPVAKVIDLSKRLLKEKIDYFVKKKDDLA